MTVHLTSREFNHDLARAKRAAREAPVVISDRGKPDLVLMSVQEYRRLSDRPDGFLERIGCRDMADVDFQEDRHPNSSLRSVDFD